MDNNREKDLLYIRRENEQNQNTFSKVVGYEIQETRNLTKDYINTRSSTIKEWEKAKRWGKSKRSLIFDIENNKCNNCC